jgi:hypothetical protein
MSTNNFAEELVVEIDALTTSYRDMKKKMTEDARVIFTNATKKIFEHYPDLESFGWRQYTPYFNDGDPCYFRVCWDAESLDINGESIDYYPDEETEETKKWMEIADVISDFLSSIDKEMLEDWFDDHARVTIHSDGRAEVDEYSHD